MKTTRVFARYTPVLFKSRRAWKRVKKLLRYLVAIYIIKLFLITFVFQTIQIRSRSMQETLQPGDRVISVPFSPRSILLKYLPLPGVRQLQRGDLVVLRHPSYDTISFFSRVFDNIISFITFGFVNPHYSFYSIRRVIGLEGDIITVQDSEAILRTPEGSRSEFEVARTPSFVHVLKNNKAQLKNNIPRHTLKEGEVFLLADNRSEGIDSRFEQRISLRSIRAVLVFRYFPFSRMRGLIVR